MDRTAVAFHQPFRTWDRLGRCQPLRSWREHFKNNVAMMAEDFWVLAREQVQSNPFHAPLRAAASPSPRQTRTGKYPYDYLRFWGFMVLRPLSWAKGGCREATSEINQTRQCLVTRPNEFVLKGRRKGRAVAFLRTLRMWDHWGHCQPLRNWMHKISENNSWRNAPKKTAEMAQPRPSPLPHVPYPT